MFNNKNIYLVGFMATGKTTIGKILAEKLNRRFIDTDREIVRKKKKSIARIFKIEGEKVFRTMERKEIVRAARLRDAVVALGGGALIDERNRKSVYRTGVLVHLTATTRAIMRRIRNDKTLRPILRNLPHSNFKGRIEYLLKVRRPFYKGARIVMDTTGAPPEKTAVRIYKKVKKIL